jgi:hypothetical protein
LISDFHPIEEAMELFCVRRFSWAKIRVSRSAISARKKFRQAELIGRSKTNVVVVFITDSRNELLREFWCASSIGASHREEEKSVFCKIFNRDIIGRMIDLGAFILSVVK